MIMLQRTINFPLKWTVVMIWWDLTGCEHETRLKGLLSFVHFICHSFLFFAKHFLMLHKKFDILLHCSLFIYFLFICLFIFFLYRVQNLLKTRSRANWGWKKNKLPPFSTNCNIALFRYSNEIPLKFQNVMSVL